MEHTPGFGGILFPTSNVFDPLLWVVSVKVGLVIPLDGRAGDLLVDGAPCDLFRPEPRGRPGPRFLLIRVGKLLSEGSKTILAR